MLTYTQDFSYTTHLNKNVTHTLEVIEEPDIPNYRSLLTISIIRKNNGEAIEKGYYNSITCKLNDSEIFDSQRVAFNELPENSEDKIRITTCYVEHNTSENTAFTISLHLKCDEIVNLRSWTLGIINSVYGTHASAEISETCTPIDINPPEISGVSVVADRYGLNASASFTAKHSAYNLTSIQFILSGLTSNQSYYRLDKETQADSSKREKVGSGTYNLILTKTKNLTNSVAISFDLNDWKDGKYPLDSGGNYPYEIIVTALNGKQAKVSGTLKVPQKVTGVTCETRIDINPGQSMDLDYSVLPAKAELLTVTFTSSDPQIATVNESGTVTAHSEGPCTITVKTDDGGYTATCLVYVLDSSVYPILEPLERYFKASHLNRMLLATQFIKLEIEDVSGEVPEFEIIYFSGRAEKILNIHPILQSLYANCERLKNAAETVGVSVAGLPEIRSITKVNASWQITINEWISFLNELHEKINGG